MAAGMIKDTHESKKQIELRAGHLDAGHQESSVLLADVVFVRVDQIVYEGQPELMRVARHLVNLFLIIAFLLKSLSAKKNDVRCQSPIPVLGKDRLSDISFVLFIKTLSVLNRSESPFINMKFEVLKNPGRLATLPLHKVEQRLALASVRVFPVHPGENLLWQDFVYAKGTTCPLPIEAFCAFMVEVRIVRIVAFLASALPIMFRNRN